MSRFYLAALRRVRLLRTLRRFQDCVQLGGASPQASGLAVLVEDCGLKRIPLAVAQMVEG
jgi:hypothetical protein